MTYTRGESRLAKVRAEIEQAKLEEAEAMAALIRQHTANLRNRYDQMASISSHPAPEHVNGPLMESARLAQEWAETRWRETWETGQLRLLQAAHEASTMSGSRRSLA